MLAQKIFDQVITHLRTQGKRSVNTIHNDNCALRSDTGLKCAIGCLIPDDMYSDQMERKSVRQLVAHNLIPTELNVYVLLLVDLQLAHDAYLPVGWEHQFELIARKYKLKYSLPCIPEQMKHLSAADLLKAEQAYADRHEHSSY